MGLLSFFQRKQDAKPAPSAVDTADGVALARTRARQRLVGAAVLVVIGVIGFPLIFETQPRPIPVDIPIEIPRKDNAPALVMPPARPAAVPASTVVAPAPRDDAAAPATGEAAKAAPPPKAAVAEAEPARKPEPKSEPKVEPKAEAKAEPKVPPKAEAKAEPKPAPKAETQPPAEATRAKALLEGKEAAKPVAAAKAEAAKDTGRFVVQVGAFTDAEAVRETRAKLDTLGLKSYTQPVVTDTGKRTRVRLGPFASREEAEQTLGKVRAAGLSAVVLTL